MRECIIKGSTDIIITENGEPVLCKSSDNSKFMTSNIFAARITEYAPQLHSYFADIGDSRRAMLSELAGGGIGDREKAGHKPENGGYKPGDFCLVQISSAPRGSKGAHVTEKIRISGVYAVLLPCEGNADIHISSKIRENDIRERLFEIGSSLQLPYSVIMRTEAALAERSAIISDIEALEDEWNTIVKSYNKMVSNGTCGGVRSTSPVISEIMKYPISSYSAICVDTTEMLDEIKLRLPLLSDRLRFIPKRIFAAKSVDSVKTALMGRKVYLKSGADIVIEKTEALTVIDVNSGGSKKSFCDINIEAAHEIMRQLRLRDIGGIIICDFIKTDDEQAGAELVRYMKELALIDPCKPDILGLTALGLMEISRKRN